MKYTKLYAPIFFTLSILFTLLLFIFVMLEVGYVGPSETVEYATLRAQSGGDVVAALPQFIVELNNTKAPFSTVLDENLKILKSSGTYLGKPPVFKDSDIKYATTHVASRFIWHPGGNVYEGCFAKYTTASIGNVYLVSCRQINIILTLWIKAAICGSILVTTAWLIYFKTNK